MARLRSLILAGAAALPCILFRGWSSSLAKADDTPGQQPAGIAGSILIGPVSAVDRRERCGQTVLNVLSEHGGRKGITVNKLSRSVAEHMACVDYATSARKHWRKAPDAIWTKVRSEQLGTEATRPVGKGRWEVLSTKRFVTRRSVKLHWWLMGRPATKSRTLIHEIIG